MKNMKRYFKFYLRYSRALKRLKDEIRKGCSASSLLFLYTSLIYSIGRSVQELSHVREFDEISFETYERYDDKFRDLRNKCEDLFRECIERS